MTRYTGTVAYGSMSEAEVELEVDVNGASTYLTTTVSDIDMEGQEVEIEIDLSDLVANLDEDELEEIRDLVGTGEEAILAKARSEGLEATLGLVGQLIEVAQQQAQEARELAAALAERHAAKVAEVVAAQDAARLGSGSTTDSHATA